MDHPPRTGSGSGREGGRGGAKLRDPEQDQDHREEEHSEGFLPVRRDQTERDRRQHGNEHEKRVLRCGKGTLCRLKKPMGEKNHHCSQSCAEEAKFSENFPRSS